MEQETVTPAPSSGSKLKLILGAVVVLALIAGAVYLYVWPKGEADDVPPSLTTTQGAGMKGMLTEDAIGLPHNGQEEVDAYRCEEGSITSEVKRGLHFYYLTRDAGDGMKLGDILAGIDPKEVDSTQIAIIFDAGSGKFNIIPEQTFYTSESGIYSDPEYVVPVGTGVIIVSSIDTTYCGGDFLNEKNDFAYRAEEAEDYIKSLRLPEEGWQLVALSAGDTFGSFKDVYEGKFLSIWPHISEGGDPEDWADPEDYRDVDILEGFNMAWVKFGEVVVDTGDEECDGFVMPQDGECYAVGETVHDTDCVVSDTGGCESLGEGYLEVSGSKSSVEAKVMKGDASVEALEFTLTAKDGEVSVYGIDFAFKLSGVQLDNPTLYLGKKSFVSNDTISDAGLKVFKFNTPYVIEAGSSKSFTLKVDVSEKSKVDGVFVVGMVDSEAVYAGDSFVKATGDMWGNQFVVVESDEKVTCEWEDGTVVEVGNNYNDGCNIWVCGDDSLFSVMGELQECGSDHS